MADVLRPNEIYLDGEYYPIEGPVRTSLISQYPPKMVFGDVDQDSNPRTSVVTWDDQTGGVGLHVTDGKEGLNRAGTYTAVETRHKGMLVLPELVTASNPSVAGTVDEICEHGGTLLVALNGGTDVYPFTTTWGAKSYDLPYAQATDSLNFTLGGVEYAAFAQTTGYSYTANITNWSDSATDVLHLAFWDDRLWGIDNTGQLWFSTTIGTEVNDAKLPLPAGYVNGLFTGPDAAGNDILYAATEVGLYAHDALNSRFVKTKVAFPRSLVAGKGCATWRGNIYTCPGGMAVYEYDPVGGTVRSMGLDSDAGLQANYIGDIERLVPTHNGLIAVVADATYDSIWEYVVSDMGVAGWHFVAWLDGDIESAYAANIASTYRLYWGGGAQLRYRTLHVGHVNPDVQTISYWDGTWAHFYPWFNAGQNEIDKTAIRVRVETTYCTADRTVKVEFLTDYGSTADADTFTISTNGITTKTFPTLANNNREAGQAFKAICIKLTLTRGSSTATNTPEVRSVSLEYRRKLVPRYGFEFDVNRTLPGRDRRDSGQMKADIVTALETSAQVEFTFVDEAGTAQNYFVDVISMEDVQQTGSKEYGLTKVVVAES